MTTWAKIVRWFYNFLQADKEYTVRKTNEQATKQNNSHFFIKFSFCNQAQKFDSTLAAVYCTIYYCLSAIFNLIILQVFMK